jgi:succinoglycan biosynthesis protein ExoO
VTGEQQPQEHVQVTVAIATFNAEAYLRLAVQSALDQTIIDLEVIVVDDGSTDGTLALAYALAAEDCRIRVEKLARNGGPSMARNRALELARGRWLAVLDSDDAFERDRLRRLIAKAEEQQADIIADNLVLFDTDDPEQASFYLAPERCSGWLSLDSYLERSIMFSREPGLGYLKPIMRVDRLRAAGLCYDASLRIAEDDDLVVRMLAAGFRYWLDPDAGYAYRRHAASTSHRLSAKNAEAIVIAGRRAIARCAALPAPVRKAMVSRQAAFERAAAFARLIDHLRGRRLSMAAAEMIKNPLMVSMLKMPIVAALRRLFRVAPSDELSIPSPAAAHAVAAILANRGRNG